MLTCTHFRSHLTHRNDVIWDTAAMVATCAALQHGSAVAMALANTAEGALIAVIADEDTITGFLLSGMGNVDLRKKTNYLVVDSKTTMKQIENTFKEFTQRDDIAIVLISQNVASTIRHAIDHHTKAVPSVLEIPSKDHPYEPSQDGLLTRVKHIMGST